MKRTYPSNLSQTFQGGKERSKDEEDEKSRQYYGIETGNRFVKRFKLLLANGEVISVPYAYLPIIKLSSKQELAICTHDLTIVIKGRNLDKVEEWLNEEKILWIRESNTALDSEDTDVFISSIQINSEWLQ